MDESKRDAALLLSLRLSAFFCLAGWTWVHFYWEGPYGPLLWHDGTYAFASALGISWDEFVGSGADDGLIQVWIRRISWLYLACTVLTITAREGSRWQMGGLIAGSGLLVVLGYAKYIASTHLPMFVEHGGQMLAPVLLAMALTLGVRQRATVITAMVAVIMTFAGHGCFALGLWPTPATYHAMISVIFRVEYETANVLLRVAGVLDVIVCVGLLFPIFRRPAALYATVWGFLTAFARPAAGMSLSLNFWGADQYLHEAVLRAPHFMIPLYLLLLWSAPVNGHVAESATATDAGDPAFDA